MKNKAGRARTPCAPKHTLVIDSLRDFQAHCTCGKWSMTALSLDRDTDEMIRERANDEYARHLSHYPVTVELARRNRNGKIEVTKALLPRRH